MTRIAAKMTFATETETETSQKYLFLFLFLFFATTSLQEKKKVERNIKNKQKIYFIFNIICSLLYINTILSIRSNKITHKIEFKKK